MGSDSNIFPEAEGNSRDIGGSAEQSPIEAMRRIAAEDKARVLKVIASAFAAAHDPELMGECAEAMLDLERFIFGLRAVWYSAEVIEKIEADEERVELPTRHLQIICEDVIKNYKSRQTGGNKGARERWGAKKHKIQAAEKERLLWEMWALHQEHPEMKGNDVIAAVLANNSLNHENKNTWRRDYGAFKRRMRDRMTS